MVRLRGVAVPCLLAVIRACCALQNSCRDPQELLDASSILKSSPWLALRITVLLQMVWKLGSHGSLKACPHPL